MFLNVRSAVLVIVTSAASLASVAAQAIQPAKVAIINAQKAVADTQEIRKDQTAMQSRFAPRQQSIEALQRDLSSIQQQLNAGNVPADREAQLRSDGTLKQRQLQRLSEDLQSDVNNERQDILGRAGRQMTEVVKKLAEERGLDVVVDISNTIYYKPGLDITAEATAAYDKAYPAK